MAIAQPHLFALVFLFCAGSLLGPSAYAANKTWGNTGTDFNSGASWGGTAPGSSDVAVFSSAALTQPNLSASLTIQELNFSTTSSSGYDLTSSSTSIKLTLTNTGTVTTSAINAANTSGTNTIDAPLVLGAASGSTQTFTQAAGGTLVVNGVISSTNSVTLSLAGGGIIQLAGANTYSGGTVLASGTTLRINNATALGTGTFTINGGTIDNTSADTITLSNNNAQAWNGDFTFTGTQNLNLGAGAVSLGTAAGTNRTVTVNANTLTVGGVISNGTTANGLIKAGAGTLVLSGANTFSGGLTLNAGTASVSSDSNLGASSGSITFGGGTLKATQSFLSSRAIVMSGSGVFNVAFGNTLEETGAISGNGALSVTGSGTLILSGSGSNGTGTTTISSGVLSLRGTVSLGSGNLIFTSGLLELGNSDFTRALGTGAGQVNMSSASGGAGFAAYGADRIVNLGGSGAGVTWGSGNFVATGQPLYIGDPTADHMVDFQNPINLNGATRTITVTAGTGTGADGKISGAISGTGSSNLVISTVGFAPWNAGSLILSNGNNSYAGTTTINSGTLLLSANATGTAGNTVLGSGTSDILIGNTTGSLAAGLFTDAAVTIGRNLRIQSGNTGTMSIGGNTADSSIFSGNIYLGTNSVSGKGVTLTAASGGTVTFSGVIQDPTGVSSGFGLVTKDGAGKVVLAGVNTYSGGTQINGGTLSIGQDANLGAIGGVLTLNAGTLDVATGFSTLRSITIGSSTSTFQIDPSQTYTVTSAIGGSGTLNKTGTGTMVLSGSNTFIGGTNVSAGTLRISASERLANTGTLTVSGGTFDLQTFTETVGQVMLSSGSITGSGTGTLIGSSYAVQSGTVSAILGGSATLTKTTSGTVTLSGANTYTGGTAINGGTLYITSSGALGSAGTISFGGGTLEYSASNTTDYSGRFSTAINQAYSIDTNSQNVTFANALISVGGSLTKLGSGTLTLSGINTYTGGTTVTGGTLQLNTNGALGTTLNGTTVSSGAALKLNNVNYSTAEGLTLNGSGIGNGGALTNSGSSTFAGPINIASNATISAGGGTLNLTGGIAKNGTTLTFSGGGTVNIMSNGITGSSPNSDLVVDGTTVVLDTPNSYNGPTTVQNSGTLKLGASNVLPTSPQTALTVNTSSSFDLASYSDGVASLTGDSTGVVNNTVASTTSTFTVNPGSGSTTFAGVIAGTNGGAQGNVALVKSGAGALVLTGANTYSGSTTINGGTLTVAASSGSALGSTSAVTVNSGGTLALGASNQINNSAPITLAGGTFAKGNFSEGSTSSTGLGVLTLTASGSHIDFGTGTVGILCFASFSPGTNTLVIDNWTGTANTVGNASTDRLIFNSDPSANLSNFWFSGYAPGASEFSLSGGYYEITPTVVPEPSTYAGAALALCVLASHFRRSRKTPRRGGTTAVSSH